jgi:8-oxo-dGTP diphosphatase
MYSAWMHMRTTVVVGAAIHDAAGRLLAARRAHPPELAGRWELPGGKVEPGETDVEALIRECREELDVDIAVGARIGGGWPLGGGRVLHAYRATVLRGGVPRPLVHSALRWLAPAELYEVDWLPADLPLVRHLADGRPPAG